MYLRADRGEAGDPPTHTSRRIGFDKDHTAVSSCHGAKAKVGPAAGANARARGLASFCCKFQRNDII
jgi:hypothetical protein